MNSRTVTQVSIAVGFLLVLAACNTMDTTTPPATRAPTVTVVPISRLQLHQGWARVPHDEAVFGGDGIQAMTSVVVGGPGLVAVGVSNSGNDVDAAVWISVDGVTWTRVPHDEAVFGGEGVQVMNSVVASGPGLVAVGFDASGSDPMDAAAAVWTSVDGMTWTRVPHDEAVFGGEGVQVMNSVVTGGPGLVAVGTDGSSDGFHGAAWFSVDGITWTRVPHDETVFGGEGDQAISSVAVGGPGLVAVGSVVESVSWGWGDDVDAAVWTSVDGMNWTRVPHDETVFGGVVDYKHQSMASVTLGGPSLVAVGSERTIGGDYEYDAAIWTSVDGVTWTRMPDDKAVFGGDGSQWINAVVAGGPGLVAVGEEASGDEAHAAVWTSVDGMSWTRVPHDEAVFGGSDVQVMNSVVAGGPGLVAVGGEGSGNDRNAAVWIFILQNASAREE